jgi:hypothetical protein
MGCSVVERSVGPQGNLGEVSRFDMLCF